MLFIINPISGKGKKAKIAQRLLDRGYKVAFTEYAGHAEVLAREATDDVVVAVGGDGTVNEVERCRVDKPIAICVGGTFGVANYANILALVAMYFATVWECACHQS